MKQKYMCLLAVGFFYLMSLASPQYSNVKEKTSKIISTDVKSGEVDCHIKSDFSCD